ncbi:tetratricopeptide repeat protein [Saccharolobus islandicus]|uniref:Uncharacterized protein n=1 Tax=Saccharolobus islandicus (strain M.14.25 / Kamchatka \|nr:hypothetical protein [Sulfolobus islandicus]ACP37599.1 hypothetical protein M1425_0789 [Sulfolobus islandicus M.14.25]
MYNDSHVYEINVFLANEPNFAKSYIAVGWVNLVNNIINDTLIASEKALLIDESAHEAILIRNICRNSKNIRSYFGNNIDYKFTNVPGWVISDSYVEILNKKNKNIIDVLEKFLRYMQSNISSIISQLDFLNKLENFLLYNCPKYLGLDLQQLCYAILGNFYLTKFYLTRHNKELETASIMYSNAINLSEEKPSASFLRAMAEINFLKGEKKDAENLSQSAIEADPNYPYAYITKAIILYKLGIRDEYLKLIKKGVEKRLTNLQLIEGLNSTINGSREEIREILLTELKEFYDKNSKCQDIGKNWRESCYYLGFCPLHPHLKPYLVARTNNQKTKKYLRVVHYKNGIYYNHGL